MNKKVSITVLCVVLVVLIAVFGVLYVKEYKPKIDKEPNVSNVYVPDKLNKAEKGEKVLLAELKEEDFKLYSAGDYVILSHNGQETEFSNWSKNIGAEIPQLYYDDFNYDGQKELVIKVYKETDKDTNEKIYCLYVLFITKDKDGKDVYDVCYVDRASWFSSFSNMLLAEMTQLDDKIQFAMGSGNSPIAYDDKTGISTSEHTWFVKALHDEAGKSYTLKNWEKGPGIIVVDEENKTIDVHVMILATYNETTVKQNIGYIKVGLNVYNDSVSLREKSVNFTPNEKYVVENAKK